MKLIISLKKSIDYKSWIEIKSFYLSYNAFTLDESTYCQYVHGIRSDYKVRENGQNCILSLLFVLSAWHCIKKLWCKSVDWSLCWVEWVELDKDIANRGVNESVSHSWSVIVIHTLFLLKLYQQSYYLERLKTWKFRRQWFLIL